MTGMLSTSLSGLLAAQTSLATIQNNISNVNTVGYSRQAVDLTSNPGQMSGQGYIGQGVSVSNIKRSYDQFVTAQLNSSLSAYGSANNYQQLAAQVDNLMADPTTGLSPVLNNFFSAANSVANDPASIPNRQVLVSDANNLAQSFNTMSNQFDNIRTQNNGSIGANVNTINSLAASIAALNVQIVTATGQTQGLKQPNDLLDKQGALLSQLAAIVNISAVPQKDGSTSVFIGNGQALVQNSGAAKFTTFQSQYDPGQLGIGIQMATGTLDITNQISGGALGGALGFQNEVLNPTQQKLGQVAAGLAMSVNAIQAKGFDLNGAAGTALFNFSGAAVPVIPSSQNSGNASVTASFQNPNVTPSAAANLGSSDYQLKYVNVGNGVDYTLTNVQNNQVINLTASTPVNGISTLSLATTQPANNTVTTLPGINMQVDVSGGQMLSAGDQFLIRPTYSAAQKMGVNITDPSKIAAATNIAVNPATNLPVPKLDASGNAVKDALGNPVYVTINGAMPSDNRNALNLANLQNSLSLLGGNATVGQAYGQIVSSVGTLTQAAQLNSSAQKTVLTQAQASQASLSGVNLDEEAANLMVYQQAYQAAAQSVAIAKSLFTTLLTAVQ